VVSKEYNQYLCADFLNSFIQSLKANELKPLYDPSEILACQVFRTPYAPTIRPVLMAISMSEETSTIIAETRNQDLSVNYGNK